MNKGPQCAICFEDEIPLAVLNTSKRHVNKASECTCIFWVCEPCWSEWCGRTNYECLVCHQPLRTQWTRKTLGEYWDCIVNFFVLGAISLFINATLGCAVMSLLYLAGHDFPLWAFFYISVCAWFVLETGMLKQVAQFLDSRAIFAIQCFILVVWVTAGVYARELVFVAYGWGFVVLVRPFAGFAFVTFIMFLPWRRGMIPLSAYAVRQKEPEAPTPRYNLRPRTSRARNTQNHGA
jgi:hypothetical protein